MPHYSELLAELIRVLPHFEAFRNCERAVYLSSTRIGMQLPWGEYAAWDVRDRMWHYGNLTSGVAAPSLPDAVALDTQTHNELAA